MQNTTLTTTHQQIEEAVSVDLADEALALALRVNHKLRQPTPIAPQPVVEDEYEPQTLGDAKTVGRQPRR